LLVNFDNFDLLSLQSR